MRLAIALDIHVGVFDQFESYHHHFRIKLLNCLIASLSVQKKVDI